jgi:hypothetical protein
VEDEVDPVVVADAEVDVAVNGAIVSIVKPPSPSVPIGDASRKLILANSPRGHRRYPI